MNVENENLICINLRSAGFQPCWIADFQSAAETNLKGGGQFATPLWIANGQGYVQIVPTLSRNPVAQSDRDFHIEQSQGDCVLQPWVARNELPWVSRRKSRQPQRGCGRVHRVAATTPLGLKKFQTPFTQGGSFLATLGFEPESLWDSSVTGQLEFSN